MAYPVIPLVGFWNNQIQYTPQFTRIQTSESGVIARNRSQLINSVRRTWNVNAVITNQVELDNFLRNRKGLPFRFNTDGATSDGIYTCIEWTITWNLFIPPNSYVGGFQAQFLESFNPEP